MTARERDNLRIILDASAIFAYTHGSVHVGETMAEVTDEEGCAIGLPVLCLAEAARWVTDTARLDLLLAHEATVVITPDPARWRQLATAYDIVGRLDAASAVEAALAADCWVLTAQPGLYGGFAGGGPIIPIPA